MIFSRLVPGEDALTLLETPDHRGWVLCERQDGSRRTFHVSDLYATSREDARLLADWREEQAR